MNSQRRLRRLRINPTIRAMVQETHVRAEDLIYPLFIVEGNGVRGEIPSMPGVFNLSLDELEREMADLARIGIRAVLLFGIPDTKDKRGSQAWCDKGIVQRAVQVAKRAAPDICVITDVCLCEYTSHGHCGVLNDGQVQNDATVELLSKAAVTHAQAGADIVAPSDMMDLRIGAIRASLDSAGFTELPIMAYSTKFASAFYGPFRDAAQSAPSSGDRKSHQLNPANAREAIRESMQDIEEGADILMVKPALCYLDLVHELRTRCDLPIAAYNVSGEYAMVKAAAAKGWIDEPRAVWEILTSIKRAGADLIITYFAKDVLSGKLPYSY